ncbi:hypothetical protein, partial [Marinobacter salsuginis]|uniref:hypothetical protein n=1 Tax=Marinobacter salsuginis TaxID=418719 RepID=UPI00188F275A
AKLRADRLWLKENYSTLSDARLQDEFERLYKIKNADVRAIKNVLSHPHNKNMVIEMFTACHLNVIPKDEWFIEKGSYLTLRYNVGFVFWLLLPITIVLALILATVEYFVPGASNSGPYAVPGFVALAALTAVGAKLLFNDISALAQATALVHEYRP